MNSYTVRHMQTLPWVKISLVLFAAFGIAAALVQTMPASGLLGGAAACSLMLMLYD